MKLNIPDTRKVHVIPVRLDKDTYNEIKKTAKQNKITISKCIRLLLLKAMI